MTRWAMRRLKAHVKGGDEVVVVGGSFGVNCVVTVLARDGEGSLRVLRVICIARRRGVPCSPAVWRFGVHHGMA